MGNINKLAAVAQVKWLCISRNKTMMAGSVMTIGMVLAFKIIFGMNTKGELSPVLLSVILSLGLPMNICTDGFQLVGTAIAEEKEKNTLRVLMTSSVTGIQYFIGSIIFPFILTMFVNYIILLIMGISLNVVNIIAFFIISIIVSLTSCVMGMIVGICAKDQMSANYISYSLMMVFMLLPVFGNMSAGLKKLSGFLFTGVMTDMAECYANGTSYIIKPLDVAVLAGELVISILVFLVLYKKNGYESD